jgi:DNA-damage-inducible protein D
VVRNDATLDAYLEAFEAAAEEAPDGSSVWYARDLAILLDYKRWENFEPVLEKAKAACANSGASVSDHFLDVQKMVEIGSGAEREIEDVLLTRYACYLIAQSSDPRKKVVAFAHTYFAVQTRRQELADQAAPELTYDEKRLALRNRLKTHHKSLASAASNAGVATREQFENFMGAGLKGMYGMTKARLLVKKKLPRGVNHIDYAGHEELAAYYFKATQAEAKLRRESEAGAVGVRRANAIHKEAGEATREAIKKLGGTMPEDIAIEEDIKAVEKRLKAAEKAKALPKPKKS